MNTHTLRITDDDIDPDVSKEDPTVVLVRGLPDIDPLTALPAILEALRNLPKPRKARADKGKTKAMQKIKDLEQIIIQNHGPTP